MRSPFRRRRKRPRNRAAAPPKPEVVDWPKDGTGGGGLMSAIRGDSDSGAGFGPGMGLGLRGRHGPGLELLLDALPVLEVFGHCLGRGISVGGLLFEAFQDHRLQVAIDLRVDRARRGRLLLGDVA